MGFVTVVTVAKRECLAERFLREEKVRPMTTTNDRRRYGVIETRFQQRGGIATYDLTIGGERWACVEWSPSRRAWCVQDASGRCLAHCDAIHGQHIDAATAVRLAKTMIRDGRMPTPEDAAPTASRAARAQSSGRAVGTSARHFGTHSGCARQ